MLGATELHTSGGDDTARIQMALQEPNANVKLGPGVFQVSAPIQIPSLSKIMGYGIDSTTIVSSYPGPVFVMAGSNMEVSEMTLMGPGAGVSGSMGFVGGGDDLNIHGVKMQNMSRGIVLNGSDISIQNVTIRQVGVAGIEMTNGNGVTVTDVDVDGIQGTALSFDFITALTCTGIRAAGCTTGIYVTTSHGVFIGGSRMLNGGNGVTIHFSSLVELSGVEAAGCSSGFLVENCAAVSLNGCGTVHGQGNSITIRGGSFNGSGIAVTGYYAEMSYSGTPFVVVDGGAVGVTIISIHHRGINTSAYDVDVSAAGGRVVFIQHQFAANRINSGGNFASL